MKTSKEEIRKADEQAKDCGCKATCSVKDSLQDDPGAAVDSADDNAVDPALVRERTCTLNNNPRNTDM